MKKQVKRISKIILSVTLSLVMSSSVFANTGIASNEKASEYIEVGSIENLESGRPYIYNTETGDVYYYDVHSLTRNEITLFSDSDEDLVTTTTEGIFSLPKPRDSAEEIDETYSVKCVLTFTCTQSTINGIKAFKPKSASVTWTVMDTGVTLSERELAIIWIDWNKDGFEQFNEVQLKSLSSNSGTITANSNFKYVSSQNPASTLSAGAKVQLRHGQGAKWEFFVPCTKIGFQISGSDMASGR